ncbi:hypothetical protein BH23ACT12_BH23ACT12_14190 [soil metagenome]
MFVQRASLVLFLSALFVALLATASAAAEESVAAEGLAKAHETLEEAKAKTTAQIQAGGQQIEQAMASVQVQTGGGRKAGMGQRPASKPESGTLYLLKPSPAAPATFVGRGGYSADGASSPLGVLSADVPPGSTTEQAYLYAYFQTGTPTPAEAALVFDNTPVTVTKLDDYASKSLSSARADVTALVAARVGSGSGISTFSTVSALPLDGLALAVVYSNPALPERTIAIFDGAAQTQGDTATFTFAAPLDRSDPGFSARMSLGIGFSYQQGSGHQCGPGSPVSKQHSVVDVNGTRLTSCAGGADDAGSFGSLITVGGVGDSSDNPADPFQTPADGNPARVTDDEYYDLEPFLAQADTRLVVTTSQPSNDDILFLSIVQVDARATVTTEICGDGRDGDGDGIQDANDPDCPGFVDVSPVPEICGDGVDNDGDGAADGLDDDCPAVILPPVAVPLVSAPPSVTPITVAVGQEAGDPGPKVRSLPVPRAAKALPRTGADPAILVLTAMALLLAGFALNRAGRRSRPPCAPIERGRSGL